MSVLDEGVRALAARIRSRELSPVEVLQAHIDRIEAVDPTLNAVVERRYEQALAEARTAEDLLMTRPADELPPLLGVPCTVKEYIAVEGMTHTGCMHAYQGRRAEQDATIVARVRAAGAIVMAITNAAEGGLWMETDNPVWGRTLNPWDLSRTCGGSSGGEGALVAAGASPFGLGADIGGSIRIPAAFCGTAGHKATGGLIPTTGHFPLPEPALQGMLCLGPLTRFVSDLWPLVKATAGPDGVCHAARPFELGDPDQVDLTDVTVYKIVSRRTRVRRIMADAVDTAASALAERGAKMANLHLSDFEQGLELWAARLSESDKSYGEILSGGRGLSVGRELLRSVFGRSQYTIPALAVVGLEGVTARMHRRVARLGARCISLRAELERVLGDNGVILYPPYTRPAPKHHHALLTPFDPGCTAVINALELPATVVPVGFGPKGLPLSVQVIAARGRDHLAIAAAGAIEAGAGGWVRATPMP